VSKLTAVLLLLAVSVPGILAAEDLPAGSWMHIADDQWEFVEVLTILPDRSGIRLVRKNAEGGLLHFTHQSGTYGIREGTAVFSPQEEFLLREADGGFDQKQLKSPNEVSLGRIRPAGEHRLFLGGREYEEANQVIEQLLSEDRRIKRHLIPLVNLAVFSFQARVEGFGGDGMSSYWREPEQFSGISGTAEVSMRSSGRILFVFPKPPVWIDMEFTDFSVFSGLELTGRQTVYAENRRGDGHLSGYLTLHNIGTVLYGSGDGRGALPITDGRITGGNIVITVGERMYEADGLLR